MGNYFHKSKNNSRNGQMPCPGPCPKPTTKDSTTTSVVVKQDATGKVEVQIKSGQQVENLILYSLMVAISLAINEVFLYLFSTYWKFKFRGSELTSKIIYAVLLIIVSVALAAYWTRPIKSTPTQTITPQNN